MRILTFDENKGAIVFTLGHAFRDMQAPHPEMWNSIVEMFKRHGLVIDQGRAQITRIPVEDNGLDNIKRHEKRLTFSSCSDSFQALTIYLLEYYSKEYTYYGDHFVYWSQKALLAYDRLSDEETENCQDLYNKLFEFQQEKLKEQRKDHRKLQKNRRKALYVFT